VLAAALWCGYSNAGAALGLPSRRSANPAYALWILAHNTATLAAMLSLEAAAAAAAATAVPLPQPRLAAAVSRAMLPTFLAANVLTVRYDKERCRFCACCADAACFARVNRGLST
jgi:hypothetical protein